MSQDNSKDEYIEEVVCKVSDIHENEMKVFPLGSEGGKILLVKQHGQYYALGPNCTHYNAPLQTGALGEGRIRCPWHGACFNIKTGDIEDYPGLNSLPSHLVTIENESIKVKAKKADLKNNHRLRIMCSFNAGEEKTAAIVGGGPAGAVCAETLRQEGFTGRIVMICKEEVLPYDRIKISKALNLKVENILLRSQNFYDEYDIEVKLGTPATGLDTKKQIVTLCNNEQIHYDYLFLATGSKPRVLDAPGKNLKQIFTIRNYKDAEEINKVLDQDKKVVILGTGFIGMEVAAYCQGKCHSVTIIAKDGIPLQTVFGDEIGNRIRKEFENKGVKFITDNGIQEFFPSKSDSQVVGAVKLLDGTDLDADIVILGIGSNFNTQWLSKSGIKMSSNGTLEVNKYLQTNLENVYAGGDIAYAPVYCAGNIWASIGHFGLAHYHGRIAALNICKKETPLKSVPFFWTMLFGKGFRYAGYGKPTAVKIHGSLEELKFFAYHCDGDKVIAMSSVGRDPIVSDFANLLYEGKNLTKMEIEKDPYKWMRNKPKDLTQDKAYETNNAKV